MKVIYAENGKVGIKRLRDNPDVDVILMDIMMPGMDGMQATEEIRKISKFDNLPIISVTAKAMKGDREKCIEAGASDYITKPVNLDDLICPRLQPRLPASRLPRRCDALWQGLGRSGFENC